MLQITQNRVFLGIKIDLTTTLKPPDAFLYMEKQQTPFVLTDGEKLSILFTRDGRSIGELAKAWGKTVQRFGATNQLLNLEET